jgi:hypothetical protein
MPKRSRSGSVLRRRRFSRRKKWSRRAASRKRISRIAKAVVLSTSEKKYKSVNLPPASVALVPAWKAYPINHAGIYEFRVIDNVNGNTVLPTQGNSDGERNGDEIYMKGLRFRCSIQIPADRKNASYAFYLCEFNSVQGNPTTYSELFHQVTGNPRLDPIQHDRWTVHKLGVYRLRSADVITTAVGQININKWIPFKRKISFTTDNVTTVAKGTKERILILCIPYDTDSTLLTDVVGYVNANLTAYYADP